MMDFFIKAVIVAFLVVPSIVLCMLLIALAGYLSIKDRQMYEQYEQHDTSETQDECYCPICGAKIEGGHLRETNH